jgi:hypothetical protein
MSLIKYTRSKMVYYTPKWLKRLIYWMWRCYWKLKVKILPDRYYVDPYAVDEIIYVDPKDIFFAMKKEFNVFNCKGKVLGGNWDKEVVKFEDIDFFKSFQRKTKENVKWEETEYYERVIGQINKGICKWSCKTPEEFDRRCKEWDRLYERIKKEGYRKGWHEDEISVNVGRNGEMIFNNGRHRLTFAKLLKIYKIPAKVTVRHKKWVAFKKEILEYSKNYGNKVYEKLTHPDLVNIPSVHSGNRYDIISKNLTADRGKLLDIGGNWGYFCHKFEEAGFECYCVEKSRLNLYFLKKLKKAGNWKFKIIPCSIFDLPSDMPSEFDVILALSIFHHFIKKESTYKKLIKFLKILKGREMFFESHNPEEPQMKNAYCHFDGDEFAEFIVANSFFNNFVKIGYSDEKRALYKIY